MQKKQYQELCRKENIPIFMQYWWLDIVCGTSNWQPILVFDKQQNIIAASFYYNKNRYGLKTITQPILTPFSGVWFRPLPPDAKRKQYQYELEITEKLIEQLPKVHFFAQNFHFSLQNILPFHWKNFQNTTRYTYIFDNLSNKEHIFKGFNESVRQVLKKGENLLFEPSDDVDLMYNLYNESLNNANSSIIFSKETLNLLYKKLKEENAGQIFLLKNADNQVVTASMLVWDSNTAYLLLHGNNRLHQSGPTAMIWNLISFIAEKNIKIFDLEGSMLRPVEKFYRSLGAERKPYFRITKASNRFLKAIFTFLKQ